MINEQLAEISNLLIVVAIVVYVLAMIGFSADLATASERRSDRQLARRARQVAPAGDVAVVMAGSSARSAPGGVTADGGPSAPGGVTADGGPSAPADGGAAGSSRASQSAASGGSTVSARSFAFAMTVVAAALHVAGIALRGVVTQRVPWANMYEFSMSAAAVTVVMFLVLSIRRPELRLLGTVVVGPALLMMLIAQTFWIVPAAELTPSLQNSHWLVIHVVIAIVSTGLFTLGAITAILQLLAGRYERTLAQKVETGQDVSHHWGRAGAILDRLPEAKSLESLSYRIHAVAFVGWTFTLIFGAVWANQAWGRFWNWDPKEVWTFISWVVYAAYLHARATRGFRGGKAAWFALAGYACVIFNYTVVNTVINGLHSYSGL